jgi:hypothetical protein
MSRCGARAAACRNATGASVRAGVDNALCRHYLIGAGEQRVGRRKMDQFGQIYVIYDP